MTLFDFLEQYLKRLEGPLALQVWNRFLQLARDLLVSLREFRPQAFAALKWVNHSCDRFPLTGFAADVSLSLQTRYRKRQR